MRLCFVPEAALKFIWFLAAGVGFLSLSQEVLWARLIGFAYASRPQAFAFVLTAYLIGIAIGAAIGKQVCERTSRLYAVSAAVLIGAGMLDLIAPLTIALLPSKPPIVFLLAVIACAALKGVIFPIAHHLGAASMPAKLGSSVSHVYFFNILGAAAGPLVTGYVLLDRVGLQTAMTVMALSTIALGTLCALRSGDPRTVRWGGPAILIGAGCLWLPEVVIHNLATMPVHRAIENKSGILFASRQSNGEDVILGGNVYDGRASVNAQTNLNGLQRVFILAALKPEAKKILVVGMSTGAWTRIVSAFPEVSQIDVVEINPGYLDLIKDYPAISPILSDPRIRIHIDDGRRWLRRNPDRKYDLIVMNTTFHWRIYITQLLSQEFISQLNSHLAPGGLLTFNTTNSPDAFATAAAVFRHAYRYMNFVYASDHDFRSKVHGAHDIFYRLAWDKRSVLSAVNARDNAFVAKMLSEPFVTMDAVRLATPRKIELISDWNMVTEYRYGIGFP